MVYPRNKIDFRKRRVVMRGLRRFLLSACAAAFGAASFQAAQAGALPATLSLDFEQAEGFEPNAAFEAPADWTLLDSAAATIESDTAATGRQSLRMDQSEGALLFSGKDVSTGIRFVDLFIAPVASDADAAQTSLHAFGSDLGFVKSANGGILVAAASGEGEEPEAMLLRTAARYDAETGASDRWLRLTLRQDPEAATWDLFIDGRLMAIDLPLTKNVPQASSLPDAEPASARPVESSETLTLYASPSAPTYLDALTAGGDNPLFEDQDRDGMPDDWERENGLDPTINDRYGDADLDGVPNIHEWLFGTPVNARKKEPPPGPQTALNGPVELTVHTPLR
jgi:hypothetical protein